MTFEILHQHEILKMLPFLGQLRVDTFREFPYLYAGTLENEKKYTRTFANTDHAFLCRAMEGDVFLGLVTGTPLSSEQSFAMNSPAQVFMEHGLNPDEYAYLGEVIVNPNFRGRGIGSSLMDLAAQEAKRQGFKHTCFLCVEREESHPLRPEDYESPDSLWEKLGYQKTNMRINFTWNTFVETGFDNPQEHCMVFWINS